MEEPGYELAWWTAADTAKRAAAHLCHQKAKPQRSLSPPLTRWLPPSQHPALHELGGDRDGTLPPCSSAEAGQDGDNIQSQKKKG